MIPVPPWQQQKNKMNMHNDYSVEGRGNAGSTAD
jgi:hypothetical protein